MLIKTKDAIISLRNFVWIASPSKYSLLLQGMQSEFPVSVTRILRRDLRLKRMGLVLNFSFQRIPFLRL